MFQSILECLRSFQTFLEHRRYFVSGTFKNILKTVKRSLESSGAFSNVPSTSFGRGTFQLKRIYVGDGNAHAFIYFWKSITADPKKVKVLESEKHFSEKFIRIRNLLKVVKSVLSEILVC